MSKIANRAQIEPLLEKSEWGIITAFRKENTLSVNRRLNAQLKSKLSGFVVYDAIGVYVEDYKQSTATPVKEEVFIVASKSDKSSTLIKLAEEFKQDSVLIGHAGDVGVLVGTTKNPKAYLKYHVKDKLGKPQFDKTGEFYTILSDTTFVV